MLPNPDVDGGGTGAQKIDERHRRLPVLLRRGEPVAADRRCVGQSAGDGNDRGAETVQPGHALRASSYRSGFRMGSGRQGLAALPRHWFMWERNMCQSIWMAAAPLSLFDDSALQRKARE